MSENKYKKANSKKIDNEKMAAWADVEKTMPLSNVTVPSERCVKEAKEWVDDNQK